jgi:hypothetical protein
MGARRPPDLLAALVALRVAIPLVTLAAAGSDLRLVPPYDYRPLNGDAFGFYAAAREAIAAVPTPLGLLGLAAGAAGVALAALWWRGGRRTGALVLGAWAVGVATALVALEMAPSGAAVVGWPLLWAAPLAPLRALGLLGEDSAFAAGLALQLLANAVTVVSLAFLGLHATGRRAVGLAAAALFALWPLLTRPLAGESAWENGQWHVDAGLHLYTEPVSTALVTAALALLLRPGVGAAGLAGAGALLGYATAVRVSNGFLAALAALYVLHRLGARRAAPLVLAGAAFAPLVAVWWPKGYPEIPNVPSFSVAFVERNWTSSTLYEPLLLLLLLVPAVAGALLLRPRATAALLVGAVLANVLFYSFYEVTWIHPRFLYASLPPLFVLAAAGAAGLGDRTRRPRQYAEAP